MASISSITQSTEYGQPCFMYSTDISKTAKCAVLNHSLLASGYIIIIIQHQAKCSLFQLDTRFLRSRYTRLLTVNNNINIKHMHRFVFYGLQTVYYYINDGSLMPCYTD